MKNNIAGILLLLAVAACNGNGSKDVAAPPAGLAGYPGQNPDSTKAYLAALDFTEKDSIFDGWLQCNDAADCTGDSVHLVIVPEKKAHKVPVDSALSSGRGYIVASIQNLSNSSYGSLNLAANETVYLWVGDTPSRGRQIAVFRISKTTGAATGLSKADTRGVCPPERGAAPRTRAAVHLNPMPQCTANSSSSASAQTQKPKRLASHTMLVEGMLAMPALNMGGLWFSCSMGCCEGSAFSLM